MISHVARKHRDTPPGKSVLGDHLWWVRRVYSDRRGSWVSQETLADEFGIGRLTLRSLEAGNAKGKSHDVMVKLAIGFGVSLDNLNAYLRGGYGEPSSESAQSMLNGDSPTVDVGQESEPPKELLGVRTMLEQALGRLALSDPKNVAAYASIVRGGPASAFTSPETLTVEQAVEYLRAAVQGGPVVPDDAEAMPKNGKR